MESKIDEGLESFERLALKVGRLINEPRISKKIQYALVRNVSYNWMRPFMAPRTYVDNIDWLIPAPSSQGVLFACNHRSFFDSYLYLFSLYSKGAKWPRNLYFPVRSDFFYDRPLGIAVNTAACFGCMYPPFYKGKDKQQLNSDALERIATFLQTPLSLVGLHPEGTRNKGNPYELLPAQPGIGQIVLKSKPMVVPVFVNGLSNGFWDSLHTALSPNAKRDEPIIITFGNPVDYDEFLDSKPRASLYKRCADKINQSIYQCGQREKELRAAILKGEISTSDPNWLWHAPKDREP